jgi:hypothetical protein
MFLITEFQITKFLITKFLIDNIPKNKAPKAQSGQNTIGFLSRRPNWDPPLTRGGGGTTLTCEREVPIWKKGPDTVVL